MQKADNCYKQNVSKVRHVVARSFSLFCSFSLSLSALSFSLPPRRKEINFDIFPCFFVALSRSRKLLILICYAQRIRAQRQQKKRQCKGSSNNNIGKVINVKMPDGQFLSHALFPSLCACVCVCVFGFASFLFLSII